MATIVAAEESAGRGDGTRGALKSLIKYETVRLRTKLCGGKCSSPRNDPVRGKVVKEVSSRSARRGKVVRVVGMLVH